MQAPGRIWIYPYISVHIYIKYVFAVSSRLLMVKQSKTLRNVNHIYDFDKPFKQQSERLISGEDISFSLIVR